LAIDIGQTLVVHKSKAAKFLTWSRLVFNLPFKDNFWL